VWHARHSFASGWTSTTASVSIGFSSTTTVGDGVAVGAQAESRIKLTIKVLVSFEFTSSSILCLISQIFYCVRPLLDSDGNNMQVLDLLIVKYYLW
jgi:Na+-driven multidrug efflux pump